VALKSDDAKRPTVNPPSEIWLQVCGCGEPGCDGSDANYNDASEVTFSTKQVWDCDIRYLHADTVMADMRRAYMAMLSAQVTLALMASADTLLDAAIEIVGSKYQEVKGE